MLMSACLRGSDSVRSIASRLSPARRYVAALLGLTLLGATVVAGVNAVIDPLSFFTLAHPLNRVQPGFDERAQKTNWLQARPGQFNAVLLGSSRSTYIDQRDFSPWRMFNYAANAMRPAEYQPYLDLFTAVNGRPPDLVVLGVDFFGSRGGGAGQLRSPESYTQRAGDIRYMVSSLLSLDLLRSSLHTVALSAGLIGTLEKLDYYDRSNIRHFRQFIDLEYRAQAVLLNLEIFQAIYGNYTYDTHLVRLWTQLRAAYPHTRFIVFTTPIAEPMFALLVREGRLDDYSRWLADLTAVFGEVWDFMGLNSVTTDLSRYRDAQHFDPGIGGLIVGRILHRPVVDPPYADFGRRVTPESLPAHMSYIRAQSACLDRDPVRTARARVEEAGSAGVVSAPFDVYGSLREVAGICRSAANEG
jgi:hypothetical protein